MNRPNILIIEDNPISRKVLRLSLECENYHVVEAIDGISALREAKNQNFDLMIQDIILPDMDGFLLNQQLRALPRVKNIPILALTGFLNDNAEISNQSGFTKFLLKPIEPSFLVDVIKEYLPHPILSKALVGNEKLNYSSNQKLEKRLLNYTQLLQRCALLMSQLSLIDGIASTISISNKDVEVSLKEILFYCLDATGISKGALYLKHNESMVLYEQVGYIKSQYKTLESFFGLSTLIPEITNESKPFAIPSKILSTQNEKQFLREAKVKYALLVPLFSRAECVGLLFLGSNRNNLCKVETIELAHTIGIQFGQCIALAMAFVKLGASESRYRQLVEISPDAIFIQQEGKFVFVNSAAIKLLSAKGPNELLTPSVSDFYSLECQKNIDNYIKQHQDQIASTLLMTQVTTLKGLILDVEMVISPFLYHEKSAAYLIMRDMTERKRTTLHLEIQYEIAWILAESPTLYVATERILKLICESLRWDCGAIWAIDKAENVLRCTRDWHMPYLNDISFQDENEHLKLTCGQGLPGEVWQRSKVIWKSDIHNDNYFIRKLSRIKSGMNTAVAFPILYQNEVLGVIEFFSKNILPPNSDLLLWFESIGNQLGLFLVRKHMEKQMLYLAEHDALTGLSNRNLLEQYLNTAITLAKENNQKLAVIFLDLDHFKYINDSMGHESGDILLKEISVRLRQCLRPHDTIGRLGGDEFVIILSNIIQYTDVDEIIDRIQTKLLRQITMKEKVFSITASIGVSFYPEDGDSVQALIKGADIAMYTAKDKGRNNCQYCTPEMTLRAENRIIFQNDLHHALENNEFVLYYQPKIDLATQKVTGMEALIRWKKANVILLPDDFISAAEASDFIIPIGEWVIKNACLQNKLWRDKCFPFVTVSVNLSIRNLNPQLLELMEQTLSESNLPPNSFEVELTESVLMENVENNIHILRSLKKMGLKISIDDFGTGYSSLSYLKRFPIDSIKIDKSFVRDIATDPDDATIVIAIIAMAHSLGFRVIAEGVEEVEQLNFLCAHGCDEIQGFYFSRPLPADEATELLKNTNMSCYFISPKIVA